MTAVLLVGGAGSAWAWTEREDRVAAEQAAQDRATEAREAQERDAAALRAQASAASRVQAAVVLTDARAGLSAAAEQARGTLGSTQDAVADDAVRQALAAALTTADTTLAATDPAQAGQSATALRALSASLTAAEAAVAAAHQTWLAEQAAAAAAAAAKPSTKPATGTSPAAPSCGTTYNGPPFYTSPATAGGDGSNGKLSPDALTAISWDVDPRGTHYYLTNAAAAALERLNTAFRAEFGHNLDLDLTYRDYDTQVAMREALGSIAAKPGTSTHGTGLALDVPELPCEYGWDTPQRTWLVSNGPSYGWVSPSWAGRNGSNPEYWHFEFRG